MFLQTAADHEVCVFVCVCLCVCVCVCVCDWLPFAKTSMPRLTRH